MANAVSRLVKILLDAQLEPEPEGFEFGEIVEKSKNEEEVYEVKETENDPDNEPVPEVKINWHMTDQEIAKLQRGDPYCQRQLETLQNGKTKKKNCFFMDRGLLHRYVTDYKQRFEALVLPVKQASLVLKLAHDDLGNNGMPQTYALVKECSTGKDSNDLSKTM